MIEDLKNECISICGVDNYETYLLNIFKTIRIEDILKSSDQPTLIKHLNKLKSIAELALGMEKNVSIKQFLTILEESFNFITTKDTHFDICIDLAEKNSKAFDRLRELFSVSLSGKVSLYKVLWGEYNLDSVLDAVRYNLEKINLVFCSESGIEHCLILPYYLNHKTYFLIHYPSSKNNKELNGIVSIVKSINTSHSFYFFFWTSDTGETYLVIKEPLHNNYTDILINSLNQIGSGIFTFNPLQISNFSSLGKKGIKNPDPRTITANKVKLYIGGMTSSITVEGLNSLNESIKLCEDNNTNMSISSIDMNASTTGTGKTIIESMRGSLNSSNVKLNTKSGNIYKFLNILKGANLIDSDEVITENMEGIIKDCFFQGKYFLKKNIHIINKCEPYEPIFFYVGDKLESTNFQLNNNQISISDNKINVNGETDYLSENISIGLNLQKYVTGEIHDKSVYTRLGSISKIEFRLRGNSLIHNVKILFGSVKDVIHHVITNFEAKSKYIAFVRGEIDGKVITEMSYKNCLMYNEIQFSDFFANPLKFIKEESKNIILNDEQSGAKLESDIDFIQLSKSGDGDKFEDKLSIILGDYLPNYINFGNKFRGKVVPDGIAYGNNHQLLYDAKSSKNITSYIDSDTCRQFISYVGFFPESEKNIFLIIGPKISQENLNTISERTEMKDLLTKNVKVIYLDADILDLLHYCTTYDLYDHISKKFIVKTKFLENIFDSGIRGQLSLIEYNGFRQKLITHCLSMPESIKELSYRMAKKGGEGIDLANILESFKDHIKKHEVK